MPTGRYFQFGEFRLNRDERLLFKGDELVHLPPKAIELLLLFVSHAGHVVDKETVLREVWPDTFVEESRLASNVSLLRKTLTEGRDGKAYIETIPKRGYRFVASVNECQAEPIDAPEIPKTGPPVLPSAGAKNALIDVGTRWSARWKSWVIACAIAISMIGAVAYWLAASRPTLSFANRDWVLIADFENRTGDSRFDKALLTAFTISLEQSRYANIFPRSQVYETLKRMGRPQDAATELTINEALGREICLRENLRALVAVGLTRTGKQYLLTGRLVDPKTGMAARSYTRKVEGEDRILDAMDGLAQSIRRDLGESFYSVSRDSRLLPQATTASLSALQYYAESTRLWQKGKYVDAQAQLLEAVRIDPDFAMAHAALGSNLYSHLMSEPKRGKEEYQRALQLSSRITDRERMFIQASFASAQNHAEEAGTLYHAFLEHYPDDLHARFNLANLYVRNSHCIEAISQYQEIIHIAPNDVNSRTGIATCYANQGKYAEALPYYARAFELDPSRLTSANLNNEYGFTLVGAGQPEKARDVFALALQKPEWRSRGLRSLGILDLYEGHYKEAAAQFQEAIRLNESEKDGPLAAVRNRLYLATTLGEAGDRIGELRVLDQATHSPALQQVNWLTYRIGVAYARAGAVEKASRILEVAKKGGSVDDQAARSDFDRLEGEIFLALGDTTNAVRFLEQAHEENHPPLSILTLDSLARAYERSGQLEQALSSYESLIATQGGQPLGWEAQQPWLEAHYALAKIHALRGNSARAIQLLDALLAIWKNADPGLTLLKKARALRETFSIRNAN